MKRCVKNRRDGRESLRVRFNAAGLEEESKDPGRVAAVPERDVMAVFKDKMNF